MFDDVSDLDDLSRVSLSSVLDDLTLGDYFDAVGSEEPDETVFETAFDDDRLLVTVTNGEWDLVDSPECRRVVVEALSERTVDEIAVTNDGLEYLYSGDGVELFTAAGRFRELSGGRDERLELAVATDPLTVAEELSNRVGSMADLGYESGLVQAASGIDSYESAIESVVGLEIAGYHVDFSIPAGATLEDLAELSTGSTARIYTRADGVPLYSLDIVDISLSKEQREHVKDAYEAIAYGNITGNRIASRAIDFVTDEPVDPVLTSVLQKHTEGYGILEDLFADPRVSDVYATSPVDENPVRVVVDGKSMNTNIHLSPEGAGAIGSRIRRTSGRAFSRAAPTVDATAALKNGTGLRIAGVTDPVAEGVAFAFREQSDDTFTLPALVENGTMTSEVAAFLSVAMERNAAALIAGTRGAGKTTLLGTLLYEIRQGTRTVVIEDTPELPVNPLQSVGRDVQALRTGTGEGPEISPADALRTALRLGDGALVVGEIRGEEARVLYEAMRVGANANAVLGTIHGDGAEDIYERVTSDLQVPASSFGATDLIVTMQAYKTPEGRKRRLSSVEGVISGQDEIRFEPLYMYDGETASSTGKIGRGESRFVDKITQPNETYANIRTMIEERSEQMATLAADGRIAPEEVARSYARQRGK